MEIPSFPMVITDWTDVPAEEYAGESGVARWRTQRMGTIRIRMVEYSAGYRADHWCAKGHVILCLEGSLDIELRDGKRLQLKAGESYHVGDGEPAHRSTTTQGTKLFIVD